MGQEVVEGAHRQHALYKASHVPGHRDNHLRYGMCVSDPGVTTDLALSAAQIELELKMTIHSPIEVIKRMLYLLELSCFVFQESDDHLNNLHGVRVLMSLGLRFPDNNWSPLLL